MAEFTECHPWYDQGDSKAKTEAICEPSDEITELNYFKEDDSGIQKCSSKDNKCVSLD